MDDTLAQTIATSIMSAQSEDERVRALCSAVTPILDCQVKTSHRVKETSSLINKLSTTVEVLSQKVTQLSDDIVGLKREIECLHRHQRRGWHFFFLNDRNIPWIICVILLYVIATLTGTELPHWLKG